MQLTITKAEAQAKIRQAYEAGTLAAQAPTPEAAYYVDGGFKCAIGCLFTDDEAKELETRDPYAYVRDLIKEGTLVVDDPNWFDRIQRSHDEWVTGAGAGVFLTVLAS